ncbi:MAG: hypothetical protein E7363_00250 [Clostridiales bacterium]|nr:hypothetical protein [Clostridiales bacterium]
MEIAVYPAGEPNSRAKKVDITVFGKHLGKVRYGEDEKNPASVLYHVCSASKTLGLILALADTTAGGAPKRSVLVAEGGKLLGITDELSANQSAFRLSKNIRVYHTSAGEIGVLSGADFYAYEPTRILTACGATFIVHLATFRKPQADIVGGALAYFNRVPVLSVSAGVAALYAENGELVYASPVNGTTLTVTPKKEKF